MQENIHLFSRSEHTDDEEVLSRIGVRGKEYMEFAALDLPILPGFIIDSDVAAYLEDIDIKPFLEEQFGALEKEVGKVFGNESNPMLVKIVVSPNLAIVHYPTLHDYGLTDQTITGFNSYVGEDFGNHEVLFLVRGNLEIELRIAQLEEREEDAKNIEKLIESISKELGTDMSAAQYAKALDKYRPTLDPDFFSDAYTQLEIALKRISRLLKLDEMNDEDAALIIQPMVYGNYGKDAAFGGFFTRNIVTGSPELDGLFYQNEFNEIGASGKDIRHIDSKYLKELKKTAQIVEEHFKEIRSIRFTVENKKVWLLDQRPVMTKSTQADIRTLLDLNGRGIIDEKYLINAIKPGQLNEILHPVIE